MDLTYSVFHPMDLGHGEDACHRESLHQLGAIVSEILEELVSEILVQM